MRSLHDSKPLMLVFSVFILLVAAAPQPANPPATERRLADIARERIQVCEEACRLASQMYRTGQLSGGDMFEWTRRQALAHMDAPEDKADRVASLETYVRQAKENEETAMKKQQVGVGSKLDAVAAQYYRLEAEVWLAKAREQ